MKTRSGNKALLCLLAALLLAGCRQAEQPGSSPEEVGFLVTASQGPASKATLYSGALAAASGEGLGIVAYRYETSGAEASAWTLHSSPAVVKAVYDGSRDDHTSKWAPVPAHRLLWPGDGWFVRFFAYFPYGATGVSVAAASGAAPALSYTVPAPEGQTDLLVSSAASTAERNGDPSWRELDVPLVMVHALTGIRFRVPLGCSIDGIAISGVYGSGTLPLGGSPLSWTPTGSATASYTITGTQSAPIALKTDATDSRYLVVEDDYTLLLLPQALTGDAQVSVTYTREGETDSRTVTASLSGNTWTAGRLIVYTVTRAVSDNPVIVFSEFDGMSQEHEEITVIKDWH